MKNYLIRTFLLTLLVTVTLLAMYFLPTININGYTLRKVNLLSDIERKELNLPEIDSLMLPPVKPVFIDTCKTGLTCIEDYADSTQRGMELFYKALDEVKERPVRIAYFGDSFIEADILTGDLRDLLQERYGGCGVGFVDIISPIYGFRQTVRQAFDGWKSHGVTDSLEYDTKRLGISCHYYEPSLGAYVQLNTPKTHRAHLDSCLQSTIFFESDTILSLTATVGRQAPQSFVIEGSDHLQTRSVQGIIKEVRWEVSDLHSEATFFGVTMDGISGIVLDNFSVRSSSGLSLRSIPLTRLKAFNQLRPYDLIVLQFGLNVATPKGSNYDSYEKGLLAVIEHLKEAFPQAGILLISVGDREYKDDEGNLRTMPGIKNLIRYQQHIAAKAGIAFWNLYDAMGGEGSMERMQQAGEANLDYTHINFKGGKALASKLFETLIYGKEQYDKRNAYENQN